MTKSRALALGLLVLALLSGGLLLGYPLLLLLNGAAEDIDDLLFRTQRLRNIAASAESWHSRAEAIRRQVAEEEQFLDGNTPALAAATLQANLKEMIGTAGGTVSSSQATPVKEEQGFTRVGVRTVLTGGITTLRDLLYAVESSRPFLLVGNLNITPQRGGVAGKKGLMTMDIEIYGYLKPQ